MISICIRGFHEFYRPKMSKQKVLNMSFTEEILVHSLPAGFNAQSSELKQSLKLLWAGRFPCADYLTFLAAS